jgi:thiamine pyrophosphate-dependent acetolactate synthase large subunit-like protein
MTTKIDEKIAALQQKLEQAKKLKSKQIAAERTKQAKEQRVLDARQKILVGAFVLAKLGVSPEDWAAQNPDFQTWLARDHDREAFGLPALPTP